MTARWLTPTEAAEHARVSRDTIGHVLRSGELRGYQRKPGGAWRIAVEDVDAWVMGEEPAPRQVPAITRRSA